MRVSYLLRLEFEPYAQLPILLDLIQASLDGIEKFILGDRRMWPFLEDEQKKTLLYMVLISLTLLENALPKS